MPDPTRAPLRIAEAEFGSRRARVAEAAREHGWDGVIVAGRSAGTVDSLRTIHWLTRHAMPGVMTTSTGPWSALGHDVLVLDADGRGALATAGIAEQPVIDDLRVAPRVDDSLVAIISDLGLAEGRLGLAGVDVLPWSLASRLAREFPRLRLEPADVALARVRLSLSDAECDMVRQAAGIGVAVLRAALGKAVAGATDGDVAGAGFELAARCERTVHWSYAMASGARAGAYVGSALPQWDPVTPYRPGDIVHPDCYGFVDGYAYDVQRTVVVAGNPTRAQQRLIDGSWEHVRLLAGELRPGITPREVFERALAISRKLDYDPPRTPGSMWHAFPHVGHAFASGFDWPWLGPAISGADEPLPTPCAITLELFWEAEGVGAAWVEDCFLVLESGVECVTAALEKSPAPQT